MFRLLKTLLSARKTGRKNPVLQKKEHALDEERIAVTTTISFDARAFTERTGYHIRHEKYFLQAMVHRSFLQMCPPNITRSNERMEFLGDSILNFIVAEFLYEHFPDIEEGELSKLRSRIVSRSALGASARALNLDEFLLMSPSAHQSIRGGSDSIMSDAFEAVIAAIYLDGGDKAAQTFVNDYLIAAIPTSQITRDENYKSSLLEFAQAHGLGIPRYVTLDESGPDHSPVFTVEVRVNGIPVGIGEGSSKKRAEQLAAKQALEHFSNHPPDSLN